eukprot:6313393-Prymnesium_polylepis.1
MAASSSAPLPQLSVASSSALPPHVDLAWTVPLLSDLPLNEQEAYAKLRLRLLNIPAVGED